MMNRLLALLSVKQKGILLIISGSILLFHTLGIFQKTLTYIIVFAALAMIIYGLGLVDAHKKIMALLKKNKTNCQSQEDDTKE